MLSPLVLIVNNSKTVADAELVKQVAAIQRQLEGDFAPAWGQSLQLQAIPFGGALLDSEWAVVVDDTPTQQYLGEHHVNGVPRGVVSVPACTADGVSVSSCLSHEVLEMAGDALACLSVQTDDGTLWAYESCDPVEMGNYLIDGVEVSNFVHPLAYFLGLGARYDQRGQLSAPRTLAPGGYQLLCPPGGQWQQTVAGNIRAGKRHIAPWSRQARRLCRGLVVDRA